MKRDLRKPTLELAEEWWFRFGMNPQVNPTEAGRVLFQWLLHEVKRLRVFEPKKKRGRPKIYYHGGFMEVVFCPHCGGQLDRMDEFWLCKPCKTIWSILDALQAALEEDRRHAGHPAGDGAALRRSHETLPRKHAHHRDDGHQRDQGPGQVVGRS